jgi:fructokinase
VIANGIPVHGLMHTEAGHFRIPHDWQRDSFPGICPYHGDCLEGLASGLSMTKRWGKHPEELSDSHGAWDLEADYLASAIANLVYAYSPQRIIVGGGVSKHPGLHQALQYKVKQLINGYIGLPLLTDRIDEYILPPALGNRSGGLGAIAMARQFELNFT